MAEFRREVGGSTKADRVRELSRDRFFLSAHLRSKI